ncbi:hypothetical protein AAE478_004211 [Parahypoxylon ruwenzoriense]
MAGLKDLSLLSFGDNLSTTTGSKSQEFRVPIAKSFSFTIPEKWRPTNPSLLKWIDTLPAPIKREEPLAPVHIQTPKHALDAVDADEIPEDDHRRKRARVSSSLGQHAGSEKRRRQLSKSSQDFMRRVSDSCRRVITPNSPRPETLDGSTVRGSPSLPGTPSTIVDRPRMRFVFVGDLGCGKSSLLLRYYREVFNQSYVPTQYELFSKTATINKQDVDLELWDTCGNIDFHQLQLLSYLVWDAIFLCFSVNNNESFENAQTKWVNEVRKYSHEAPIFLLGLKKDTRVGSGIWAPLFPNWETRISATEGSMAANGLGAVKYMECSAKTGEGVERIFEEAVRVIIGERAADEDTARLKQKGHRLKNRPSMIMCFK